MKFEISTPMKVGLVLLIVCLLLKLSPRDTLIILISHYVAHQIL
jgi:hypothetical protein